MLDRPGTVWLDTSRFDRDNARSLFFADPARVIEARTLAEVPAALDALETALADGRWVAGYLAYEAGYAFERIAPLRTDGLPLVWLGVYDAPAEVDAALRHRLLADVDVEVRDAAFALDRTGYGRRIRRIKEAIREGDVYQINFTAPLRFRLRGAPEALFARLSRRQPVGYGAFLHVGEARILSLSPELFFRRAGRRVWTRPMKGTARRGADGEEDARIAAALQSDEKNRAENLMIVDLLRNDLSIVCKPGTVRVPALFETETYPTVIQMTSTVEGRLRAGAGTADVFRALFPCGSVTGAPKISAMRLIHALEDEPRGVYCGAVGYAAPGGEAAFNVAIRTAVLRGGPDAWDGTMGLGSGVVWDSDAGAEYDECLLKARFLTEMENAYDPAGDDG